ncbi:MAG: RecX family transcriptional regulator [Ignavibacteria bacterium]|nr:RecX family transcriptional regulator [Ignavibacteria bacterium]
MPTITAIKRTVRDANRCSVFVDDQFFVAVSVDVVAALGLRIGLELSAELSHNLTAKERELILRQKSYHFASYKPRSERHVREFLIKKHNATNEEADGIIEWLKSFNIVNDVEFAQRFLDAARSRKPLSRIAAQQKLLVKGIPPSIVEEALITMYDDDEEFSAAFSVAQKKLKSLSSDSQIVSQRLSRFLQGRGYRWETVKRVLQSLNLQALFLTLLASTFLPLSAVSRPDSTCIKIRLPENVNRFQPVTQPVIAPDGSLYLDRKLHPDNSEGPNDPDEVCICPLQGNNLWGEPTLAKFTIFKRPDVLFNFTTDGLSALVVGPYSRSSPSKKSFAIIHRKSVTSPFTDVKPIELPGIDSLGRNFYGYLTDDRKMLILALDLEGGVGDLDLYVSNADLNGWTKPVLLSPNINTQSFEGAPWLSHDGVTLYYSSSGHTERRGKADLFMVRFRPGSLRTGSGRFVIDYGPVNLGSCINTVEDETSITLRGRGDTVLLTSWDEVSARPGIYTAVLNKETRPLPWCRFTGTITDAITGTIVKSATIRIYDTVAANQFYEAEYHTDTATGLFSIALPSNRKVQVITTADGYVSHKQIIGVGVLDSAVTLHLTTELFSVKKPLYSIFFERGQYIVSEEQARGIAEFAKKYDVRQIAFEVSGYTDRLGTTPFNQTLSWKRAQAVRELIVESGIYPGRVAATGRGIEESINEGAESENPQSRRVDVFAAEPSQ